MQNRGLPYSLISLNLPKWACSMQCHDYTLFCLVLFLAHSCNLKKEDISSRTKSPKRQKIRLTLQWPCVALPNPINCLAASKIPPLASGSQSTKDQSQVANLTTWDKTKPLPRPTPPHPPKPTPPPTPTPTPHPRPKPPTPLSPHPDPTPQPPTTPTPTPHPSPTHHHHHHHHHQPYLLVDDSCRLPNKPLLESLRRVFFLGACPGNHKR